MTLHQLALVAEMESAVLYCVNSPSAVTLAVATEAVVTAFNARAIDQTEMLRVERTVRHAYKCRIRAA